MKTAKRSLAFGHPDLDAPADTGFRVNAGRVAFVEGTRAIRQGLLLLLSTRRGERVMRPQYGCDLHRIMFMPNDATTAGLAMHYVRQAIERWAPDVRILHLDAGAASEAPHASDLEITLSYRVRSTGQEDHLVLAVPMDGETSP